jgi:hypothetical protein
LPPAALLPEFADSLADLDADIRGHSPSIDLVEALYLVDALFSGIRLLRASGLWRGPRYLLPTFAESSLKSAKSPNYRLLSLSSSVLLEEPKDWKRT